jgi:tetratricopeptide (TPR) repeat protein
VNVTVAFLALSILAAPRVSYARSIQDLPPDDPASDPTVDEPTPTVTVTSGGDQAPAAVYDGYGDIDWDGPDVFVRSPLDFAATSTTIAMEGFEMATDGLAGSFPARPVTYDQALARIRGLFAAPKAKEVLAKLRAAATADPKATATRHRTALYAAIKGDLSFVLVALLVDHELDVNDPDALFNLAGAVSQAGLPNEALAFLDRLEASKRLPRGAFGYDPRACIDYARGYSLMLIGKLNESEAALEKALAREKFFADAHYTLAIVKKARGGDPKKHLMMGVWRMQPAAPRFCGAMFRGDPLEGGDPDEPIAVSADRLFDLSKGIDGVLPRLSHPSSGERLLRMMNDFNESSPELYAEVSKYAQLASDIYENELLPRFQSEKPNPRDVIDQEIMDVLEEANVHLVPLLEMLEQKNLRLEELGEVSGREREKAMKRWVEIIQEDVPRPVMAAKLREVVSNGISRMHLHVEAYDLAVRVHFRSWHKWATAIASLITDPAWRRYADARIRAMSAAEWSHLYAMIVTNYAVATPSEELYAPDPDLPRPSGLDYKAIPPCTKSPDLKVELTKGLSVGVNCDEAKVSVGGTVAGSGDLGLGVGVVGEVGVKRNGDLTISAGPKGSAKAGVAEASTESKGYITVDSRGIKSVGVKVGVKIGGGAGGAKVSQAVDEVDFNVWQAPPHPAIDPQSGLRIDYGVE